ncbi:MULTISPECIES: hypothetical protein [Citrobacter]|uniref:hypothetical protein n=1 Tax=Citrobacter TaxID=544 RepID=UPI0015EA910A|nr:MULTISPECIES: hypothetical protein [Citrobacter]MDM3351444.1 hypothetical protein [Citrobacter sp. Cb007]QLR15925.1 hypothetical protein HV352_18670 [Citrobacter sp. RHBSTW-01044]
MIRKYEDYDLEGYEVPLGYRLLKRTETHRNVVYLDAPSGEHCTAYLIVWWYPKPDQIRLRVWRSYDFQHQKAIGELPQAFVAHQLKTYDVQLMPVNNAFWRKLGAWALEECYQITAEHDRILSHEKLVKEFYGLKRLMLIHKQPDETEFDRLFWQYRKIFRRLANPLIMKRHSLN